MYIYRYSIDTYPLRHMHMLQRPFTVAAKVLALPWSYRVRVPELGVKGAFEVSGLPGPPKGPFIEPLWYLIVAIWGILEGRVVEGSR